MKLLFLIGMPGAGKTWWGKQIADAYGYQFFDLDTVIEKKQGKTIPAIFAGDGEAGFREKENLALKYLIKEVKANTIVSCGGGTPVWLDNMDIMKKSGCVIYLQASFDSILNNLHKEDKVRPLLQVPHVYDELMHLYEERKAIYEEAHYILQVENISVATFAQIINSCTDRL
jgi:shikimate kinase